MSSPYTPTLPSQYSDALADAVWKQRCGLLFQAWVQVRYHRRRQRFFDLADKGTKSITLVLGASLFGKHLASLYWVATGISALGLLALVFGYGDRKQLHKELAEQAAHLAASIEGQPAGQLSVEMVAQWAAEYVRFCAKAPPPLKTLTLLCEREQATLEGHANHVAQPAFWRRWLSQVVA